MMGAKQKKVAIREWTDENDDIMSARIARGISVFNHGIPMESNEVAFISCDDDRPRAETSARGLTLVFFSPSKDNNLGMLEVP